MPASSTTTTNTTLTPLQSTWQILYTQTLPSLARAKDPAQHHWPVHLDHCFARIILDAVIGGGGSGSNNSTCTTASAAAVPWTLRLKSPAIHNMTTEQLERCVTLGHEIVNGMVDLVELDRRSLEARGKTIKGKKRKAVLLRDAVGKQTDSNDVSESGAVLEEKTETKRKRGREKSSLNVIERNNAARNTKTTQPSIRTAMGLPSPPPSSTSPQSLSSSFRLASQRLSVPTPSSPAASIPADLHDLISTTSNLTPFRQRVLLCLCQIPRGHYSTYLALSRHLGSAPRAVGNALRNNPFAPRVP